MTTRYLPATIRDVEVLVEASDDEGGARSVIHEFPGRDEAFAEPSGKYTRRFTLETHLIGSDFEQRLAALEEALNEPGPIKIVHPHRGTLYVALDGPYRIRRSTRELGMVRVSMPFVEAGQALAPRVLPDTVTEVKNVATVAKVAMQTLPLDVEGPDFLNAAATAILAGPGGFVAKLGAVNNRINAAFGLVDLVSSQITAFGNQVSTLLSTPDVLVLKLQGLMNAVVSSLAAAGIDLNRGDKQRNAARVGSVLGYLSTLGTFGDGLAAVPTPTPTREQEATNQNALADLIEASALAEAVGALVDLPLDNTDQAGDVLEQVSAVFDHIEERGTVDDAQGQALRDLRASFYAHLRGESAELKTLGRYTPPVTTSALALAYLLYGDSARAEEIIERNGIEHPGFIQGGVELVVANV